HEIRNPVRAGIRQPSILLKCVGFPPPNRKEFINFSSEGGPYFQTDHCARGVAYGDLDNDGRVDMVISHQNEPVAVLRNLCDSCNHWLGIELVGKNHRDVVGARLILEVNGQTLTRFMTGGSSYLSASDPRRVFGLGSATKIDKLTVEWPWGRGKQTWKNLPID